MKAITLIVALLLSVIGNCNRAKYQNDQYSKRKQVCTNLCEPKGYFQENCLKICMSLKCYQSIYLNQNVNLELGMVDPN